MTDQLQLESTDAFARLGRIRFDETPLDEALAEVTELARRTIPGAREVSVTLVGVGGAQSAACTGELALILDEWQYAHGHGPCLAAAAANITVPIIDIAADSRWPDWADRAINAGAHGVVSVGLPLHHSFTGALNVYSAEPEAFDADAVILAETFAGYAAVAMANAHRYDSTAAPGRHMRAAMINRAVIEQATGIIMAERRCTAQEAFEALAKLSQYSERDVRDIAAALVASAAEPPAGTGQPSHPGAAVTRRP